MEARLIDIRKLLPAGVTIRPYYSQGDVVDRTTRTVFPNLAEGGLLVTLILLLFLRNVRAALITASVIPLSLLVARSPCGEFNVSANLMSLGALDFGLLVDASIVMVENFVRRLERAGHARQCERRALFRAAAFEVGRPDRLRRRDHHRRVCPDLLARRVSRVGCSGPWHSPSASRSSARSCSP